MEKGGDEDLLDVAMQQYELRLAEGRNGDNGEYNINIYIYA